MSINEGQQPQRQSTAFFVYFVTYLVHGGVECTQRERESYVPLPTAKVMLAGAKSAGKAVCRATRP